MLSSAGRLLAVHRAFLPLPAPTGGLVLGSDLSGMPGVYRLHAPGQPPEPLAVARQRIFPVALTPHGILVRSDSSGDEMWRPALLDEAGGMRPLVPEGAGNHRSLTVSPDGHRVGAAVSQGGADWALAELALPGGRPRSWARPGGTWRWRAWSPDARAAVVSQDGHTLVNHCFILRDGQFRPLLPTARHIEAVVWLDRRILAVTDLGRDFHGLVEVDPAQPDRVARVLFDDDHDVLAAVPCPAGRRVALVVNVGSRDEVWVLDLATGSRVRCTLPAGTVYSDGATEPGDHLAWSPGGTSLFLAWESSTSPAGILEAPVDPPADPVAWASPAGPLPPGPVAPEPAEFGAGDGRRIPALFYRAGPGPRPAVVWFHGGPEGQSRDVYNPVIATWNAAGFHVLAPNVRGSTGYGYRFASLDDRELRWDSVRDACAAGRWLCDQGLAGGLVAAGRSYGGFLALAALIEEPALWSAGVVIAGIADWHSFFRHTSRWRRASRIPEYGDPDGPDGAYLAAFSPLARAAEIRAPLLLIHGERDARVPVSEARQLHARVPGSELITYPDEGHHITRHDNLVNAYGRALEFVRQALSVAGDPPGRTHTTR